jgi:hypothetical protein
VPDLVGTKDSDNGQQTGSRARRVDDDVDRPDMLIGMNVLNKLHLYIAFDERKLYVSEASTPPKPDEAPAATVSATVSTAPQQ